jgi:hypothetical protein
LYFDGRRTLLRPESPAGAAAGIPPREDRFELVFAGDGEQTLQINYAGTGEPPFASADALSEYLLTPVCLQLVVPVREFKTGSED